MKILIIAVVIIVLGIGAYFVLGGPAANPLPAPEAAQDETPIPVEPDGGIGSTPAAVVHYTSAGFSPASVSVKVGDTVRFVNDTSLDMWIGSNDHPEHSGYSGTERKDHCPDTSGTAFDQCSVGDTFEFTFTKAGTWGYHNHKVEEDTGTIIVTP